MKQIKPQLWQFHRISEIDVIPDPPTPNSGQIKFVIEGNKQFGEGEKTFLFGITANEALCLIRELRNFVLKQV